MATIVTRNAPAGEYIAYREEDNTNQVTVTDGEINLRAEGEQRQSWEEGEAALKARADDAGEAYQERPYEGFTPPSTQAIREGYARTIAEEKLADL